MSQADWNRIKDVLSRARDLPVTARESFVRSELPDVPALADEVMSLLAADDRAPELLRAMEAASDPDREEVDLRPDESVGPYRLVERIGEGGMGDVWLAEQTRPLRRRVALKIIKLGMNTRRVVARFDQERQALALMDHPNIAKVYDAGAAPGGRPFFVMELVRGQPLTDYADANRLDPAARIDLFLQVCRAAQHAHQKGVVHRDLKPSNLLVQVREGRPTVKVIDFGIAKALGPDVTDLSVHTQLDQIVGTPDYMSPEQADPSTRDVDTRADVYSLGVVLYELLTGTRPYHFRSGITWAAIHDFRGMETIRPSKQLTASGTQATVADERSSSVSDLRRQLAGDLDWIVMKAIEKDRTRRYETVSEMALDLERFLRRETVLARPPSTLYRMRKFVARNRSGVAAALIASLAVVTGASAAALGWARAAEEARVAEARELAATSIMQLDRDPELGLLLALESARTAPTVQAEDALDRALDSRILNTLRYDGPVYRSSLSADGRRIATITADGRLLVRDLESASELLTLTGVQDVVFRPDGRSLAVATEDGAVRILNSGTGDALMELSGPGAGVRVITMDEAGRRVAGAATDGTVRVWDLEARAEIARYEGHDGEVLALTFRADGRRVASGGEGMEVHVWDVADPAAATVIPPPPGTFMGAANRRATLLSLAFSPDGTLLASAGTNGLRLWDPETGAAASDFEDPTATLYDVTFSPDGSRIAGASYAWTATVWHVRGARMYELEGHTDIVTDIRYTPDGERLVSTSMDGTVRVWDATRGAAGSVIEHPHVVWDLEYSPDGRSLVTAGLDGAARIFDARTGDLLTKLSHRGAVFSVAFDPDGRRVATGAADSTATVWDASSGAELLTLRVPEPRVDDVAFSPDGRLVVTGSGNVARVWDAATGEERHRFEAADRTGMTRVAFAGGGRWLVTAGRTPKVFVRDASTGEVLRSVEGHGGRGGVEALAVHPAGRIVGTAGADGGVELWDAATGEPVTTLEGHRRTVYGIDFSHDGRRVATAAFDRTAKVWDIERGEILTLDGFPTNVFDVVFSPDGTRIAGASDGEVRIFAHGLEHLARVARTRARRDLTVRECTRYLHGRECPERRVGAGPSAPGGR